MNKQRFILTFISSFVSCFKKNSRLCLNVDLFDEVVSIAATFSFYHCSDWHENDIDDKNWSSYVFHTTSFVFLTCQ